MAPVSRYTAPEKDNEVHCYEGGENCQSKAKPRASSRARELWTRSEVEAHGFVWRGNSSKVSSHEPLGALLAS